MSIQNAAGSMQTSNRPVDRNAFNIAVICALSLESNAVEGVFDEIWRRPTGFGKSDNDPNTYTLGRMGYCNVVLAYLPHKGKAASASTSAMLLASFPKIELVIVVGVCGGVPNLPARMDEGDEIIMGDVVISTEIHQFDYGRLLETGFQGKSTVPDSLGRASNGLRAFINYLRGFTGTEQLKDDTILQLRKLVGDNGKFRSSRYLGVGTDMLFPVDYIHKHRDTSGCLICSTDDDDKNGWVCDRAPELSCEHLGCDKGLAQPRRRLQNTMENDPFRDPDIVSPDLAIHFGPIASGDQVIRSAKHRDLTAKNHGVIAFEMEGAGVWDNISTVVIKGVSDYADSHKDKEWQPYAAAVAAACMKAFLQQFVDMEPAISLPLRGRTRTERMFTSGSWIWVLITMICSVLVGILAREGVTWEGVTPTDILPPVELGLDPRRPIFGVLGKTGVGKSTFIDILGGRNSSGHPPVICHGLESCTNDLEYYEATVDNSPVYLIDTPGFDDSRMTDEQIMRLIVENLQNDKLLKGLIYLHDITQPRMGRLAENHMFLFEKLCGVQSFQNIMLVTTRWVKNPWADVEESERQLAREEELKGKYWKEMIAHGSTVAHHDGTAGSARRIITWLLNTPMIMRLNPRNRPLEAAPIEHGHSKGPDEENELEREDPKKTYLFTRLWRSLLHRITELKIIEVLALIEVIISLWNWMPITWANFEKEDLLLDTVIFLSFYAVYLYALYSILFNNYCDLWRFIDLICVSLLDLILALSYRNNDFPGWAKFKFGGALFIFSTSVLLKLQCG
ncbi:hypothetical protein FQN53_004266 [Emmonsiellopsis sp. PD_33]|nr:hypothetical protein FQN53_004266 [Emmonsiellopsis sp. PD_33]